MWRRLRRCGAINCLTDRLLTSVQDSSHFFTFESTVTVFSSTSATEEVYQQETNRVSKDCAFYRFKEQKASSADRIWLEFTGFSWRKWCSGLARVLSQRESKLFPWNSRFICRRRDWSVASSASALNCCGFAGFDSLRFLQIQIKDKANWWWLMFLRLRSVIVGSSCNEVWPSITAWRQHARDVTASGHVACVAWSLVLYARFSCSRIWRHWRVSPHFRCGSNVNWRDVTSAPPRHLQRSGTTTSRCSQWRHESPRPALLLPTGEATPRACTCYWVTSKGNDVTNCFVVRIKHVWDPVWRKQVQCALTRCDTGAGKRKWRQWREWRKGELLKTP